MKNKKIVLMLLASLLLISIFSISNVYNVNAQNEEIPPLAAQDTENCPYPYQYANKVTCQEGGSGCLPSNCPE